MLEAWIGEAVGRMHIAGIEHRQLAEHMGVSQGYVSMILNGKKTPADAEQRVMKALDELLRGDETARE